MFGFNGRVLLRDNRNLSQDEFLLARNICNRILRFVEERDDYVQQSRVPPVFCYGDANWSKDASNDYTRTFRKVVECCYEVINRLRSKIQAMQRACATTKFLLRFCTRTLPARAFCARNKPFGLSVLGQLPPLIKFSFWKIPGLMSLRSA
jgi:hypothetical protein